MMTPDVKITNYMILRLEKFIKNFQKFTLLAPVYKNQNIHKNYNLLNTSENMFKIHGHSLLKVKDIDGCLMLLNKKN